MSGAQGVHKGTVLIVDDEPQIRAVCAQALEQAGYAVVVAEDGESALRELGSCRFDAAVLDIVLPDTDGVELLRAIRERDREVVVVLVTGFASLDTAMEAVRLGAYEYVRKPFRAAELLRIVERGIEGRRLRGRNDELLAELRRANEELIRQQEQLRERMRVATEDLTAFVELGQRLSGGGTLAETLQSILEAGARLTRARAGAAYALRGDPPRLHGILGVGLPAHEVTGARVALDEGVLGRVAARRVAHVENDVLAGAVADDDYLGFVGVQSVLAAPLISDDQVHGVMAFFDHAEGQFSEDSMNLVRVLAGQAARVVAAMAQGGGAESGPPSTGFVDLADLL